MGLGQLLDRPGHQPGAAQQRLPDGQSSGQPRVGDGGEAVQVEDHGPDARPAASAATAVAAPLPLTRSFRWTSRTPAAQRVGELAGERGA